MFADCPVLCYLVVLTVQPAVLECEARRLLQPPAPEGQGGGEGGLATVGHLQEEEEEEEQ